jgi:hypothetical protein
MKAFVPLPKRFGIIYRQQLHENAVFLQQFELLPACAAMA